MAGVAIADGHVLLHRRAGDDFWTLPGGRPQPMETAADCLRRELQEETGQTVSVSRLVWIVENFFTYDAASFHEMLLCFEMTGPSLSPQRQSEFAGIDEGVPLTFRWCPLDRLDETSVRPAFLRTGLHRLPSSPRHIIQRD